jgi:drug/metabolite transporter (DMT)-like permease
VQFRPVPAEAGSAGLRGSVAGIALTALAVLIFAVSNTVAKWVMGGIPVGETLFVRTAVTLALLVPMLRRGDFARARAAGRLTLHLLRVGCSATEVFCYYSAVAVLPMADVATLYMATPIYMTAMAAAFLRERVGWRRWAAVVVGFGGVLVALRPSGSTLSVLALIAVAGSLFYAVSLVATRRLRGAPNTVLVGSQVFGLMVVSLFTAPGWVWPAPGQAVGMVLVGLLSMAGYLAMNRGLQLAAASVVAPFNYTGVVWAAVFGFLAFGEVPGASVIAGAIIIIGAGLFIALREHRLGIS